MRRKDNPPDPFFERARGIISDRNLREVSTLSEKLTTSVNVSSNKSHADYLDSLRHCQGGIGSFVIPHSPSPFSFAIRSNCSSWSFFRYRRYAQAWPSDTISWLIFRSPTKISAITLSYRSTPDTLATIDLLATFFESAREGTDKLTIFRLRSGSTLPLSASNRARNEASGP